MTDDLQLPPAIELELVRLAGEYDVTVEQIKDEARGLFWTRWTGDRTLAMGNESRGWEAEVMFDDPPSNGQEMLQKQLEAMWHACAAEAAKLGGARVPPRWTRPEHFTTRQP